ncbi:Uma2 family endonuclease [Actinocatenispora sera]|uniref:Uma2 family endonuclease n=1 Tax=Actinocatenispora sera TaxID=390989 RepID=UPI00340BC467
MTAQPVPVDNDELLRFIAEAPHDGHRYEIDNGELIVTPPASGRHQNFGSSLYDLVRPALPNGWALRYEFGLSIGGRQAVPDLVVFDHEPPDTDELYPLIRPRLVVEIESISTRRRDRVSKPEWYARGGADAYWRIEADETVHVYTEPTSEGLWNEVRVIRPGSELAIEKPFPIVLRSPIR